LKKPVLYVLFIAAGLIAGFVIAAVLYLTTGFSLFGGKPEVPSFSVNTGNQELVKLAMGAAEDIKNNDFQALSQIVHPELGVVFSPYATITLSTNKCFLAEQIAAFGTDTKSYVWGVHTGSGEPIELTVADYFAQFVFDRDYTVAPIIGINHTIRSGNALENITDVFPDVKYVDFYIPGTERDSAGNCDWSSLRLGFEVYEGSLRLTVIVHNEWAE